LPLEELEKSPDVTAKKRGVDEDVGGMEEGKIQGEKNPSIGQAGNEQK